VIWPLLRTRRWLAFTAVVVGTIIAFGLLSHWQWNRAEERRQERITLQSALAANPVPLDTIGPGDLAADEWRAVSLQGRYLPNLQAGVRKRPLDARNGFWLMTALQPAVGPVVWINRGWLPAGEDALSTPDFPAPPTGPVRVTGYLRSFEDPGPQGNQGLPDGQIAAPALPLLPAVSEPLPSYVQLATSQPEQDGLVALPLPTIDEGRNVSYAVQWLLFAAVAMGGWYFFLRREAIEDAERRQAEGAAVSGNQEA
jgi:cytochrome oxidase assembly protein ShyY1